MPPAPAAPPAAPPASTSPPAPPASTPPAAPAPTPPPAPAALENEDKAFLEAWKLDQGGTPPAAPAATPPKPAEATPPKPAATPPKPKPDVKPEPKPAAGQPNPNAQLRQQYDATKAELDTVKNQHTELQKKIADYEARGKDTEAMRGRLESMEKEKEELLAELYSYRVERKPEFQQKFEQPFQQAVATAKADIEQMLVTNEDGTERPATWNDFAAVYQQPNANKAAALAKALFGEDLKATVIEHVNYLKRIDRAKNDALAFEKQNAATRMKEEESRQAQMREQEKLKSAQVRKDLADSVEYYRDDPADKEAIDLRNQAFSKFDEEPKTHRERIIRNELIRHRVAALPVALLKIKRLEAELAELKGQGGEDPNNIPTARNVGGGEHAPEPEEDWNSAARKFASTELGQT